MDADLDRKFNFDGQMQNINTLLFRYGFVRLALIAGASLVPVFAFGENELYKQVDNPKGSKLRAFQEKVKKVY